MEPPLISRSPPAWYARRPPRANAARPVNARVFPPGGVAATGDTAPYRRGAERAEGITKNLRALGVSVVEARAVW